MCLGIPMEIVKIDGVKGVARAEGYAPAEVYSLAILRASDRAGGVEDVVLARAEPFHGSVRSAADAHDPIGDSLPGLWRAREP